MSTSAATNRTVSTRRLSFPQIALVMLGLIALFSVIVAISLSSAGSGRSSSVGTGSLPALLTPGHFRDPVTHALLPVPLSIRGADTADSARK